MIWRTNKEINNETVNSFMKMVDKDLLINRICYTLNITKTSLLEKITEDEIELLFSSILINRGITAQNNIDKLFNSINEAIISPYNLINAKEAANRISEYLKNPNAIIYVYADYDSDGINSGYVMTRALQKVSKCPVIVKYPNRIDGYGLSMDFCKEIVEKHQSFEDFKLNKDILVITVDNGITKVDEVKYLKDNGIEVIITDHHESTEDGVPDCLIVDPHNKEIVQDDSCKHLCGCGVAFKIAQLALENFNRFDMMEFTPYLAIATLSDVMPLTDENIAFIQYGLEIMNSNNCPAGIKQLMKSCNIDVMTAKDILWTVAPMLNACGRMGDTELGADMFFQTEYLEDIVNRIIQVNEKRKALTKKAQKDLSKLNFDNHNVCIIPTDEYPIGIVGIIAGKVAEQFNKPAIIVSKGKDNSYHGSVRSVNGIDMKTLLEEAKKLNIVDTVGGHKEACACGFTLDNLDKLNEFFDSCDMITESLSAVNTGEEEVLHIDEIITLDHLSETVYSIVNLFPCDNKTFKNPVFALTNLEVVSYNLSKSNPNNIKFTIKQDNKKMDIWAWGFAHKYINELKCPSNLHIAGTIEKSFMNGKYSLNVVDIAS